jgi:hypothetical protein
LGAFIHPLACAIKYPSKTTLHGLSREKNTGEGFANTFPALEKSVGDVCVWVPFGG